MTDTATAARPPARNGFLDTVRSIAVVRVVLWHAFATAALSWSVASMPAMFFVAGSLLAGSLDRRPASTVIRNRLRRLLIPFWVFAGVVLSTLAVVHRLDDTAATVVPATMLLRWFIPLLDPKGSPWEAGWVSTPLWYLRCYLWLMLLSPLLRAAHRRMGNGVIIVPLVGIFAMDFLIRHPSSAPHAVTSARWYLGDLVTYSLFLILGFAHHDGLVDRVSRRDRWEWAAVFMSAALVWNQLVEVPGRVVNNSYPLLLFVGASWLAVFLALEPWLASLPSRSIVGPVLGWIGRRSMTIYLWHTTAIVAAYWARAHLAPSSSRLTVLPGVVIVTVILCVAFGWVEDVAARRPPEWWPNARWNPDVRLGGQRVRSSLIGGAAGLCVGALAFTFVVPSAGPFSAASPENATGDGGGATLALPPAPSAKPDAADFGSTSAATSTTSAGPASTGAEIVPAAVGSIGTQSMADAVTAASQEWLSAHDVAGVVIGGSASDGSRWIVAAGSNADGSTLDPEAVVPITSATKTMTAALILQLVDEGLIGLDDPLPELTKVPDFPFAGKVTIRQLLMHTSGIPSYTDVAAYQTRAATALTPVDALELSATEPLQWEPGTVNGYSATGYITLGLLAEQLTGTSYADLVAERLFGPAGMKHASIDDTPTAGWIGYSAGGGVASVEDLVSWGAALFRDGRILSPDALSAMTDVNNEFSAGLGAFPICPCSTEADGTRVYTSIGHHGGQVTVQYSPSDGLVLAISLTESMWTSELTQSDVAQLLADVRAVVDGQGATSSTTSAA